MAKITADIKFDQAKGSAAVTLDLIGESEMEHELLGQFFASRSVALVPFHVGDELESRFVISDPNAFSNAQRACENRIRVRNGQPTVEQEEAARAAKAKAVADRKAADEAAQKDGYTDAADKEQQLAKASEFDKLASAIADKLKPAK